MEVGNYLITISIFILITMYGYLLACRWGEEKFNPTIFFLYIITGYTLIGGWLGSMSMLPWQEYTY